MLIIIPLQVGVVLSSLSTRVLVGVLSLFFDVARERRRLRVLAENG